MSYIRMKINHKNKIPSYLKSHKKFGKPLKVRKVFYLNEEAKKRNLNFVKK